MINGLTDIVLTKVDVLGGLDEIKVCIGYEIDGEVYDYVPSDQSDVAKAKPVYKVLQGWKEDISKCRTWDELPEACKSYVEFIEQFCEIPVSMISVGADRENNIYRNDRVRP